MDKDLEHRNKARSGERLFCAASIDLLNLLSWEDYKKTNRSRKDLAIYKHI